MADDKKVADIMIPIEEYEKVDEGARLSDVLAKLKKNYEQAKKAGSGTFHTTVFITDSNNEIIGKLSMYDIVRGLVPEGVKKPEASRVHYSTLLSSRIEEVAEEIGEIQERFKWLHRTFLELVKEEVKKGVKDIMTPVHPILTESDSINHGIYVMFKENIRQPLVVRDGKIVGVFTLKAVFDELMELVGPAANIEY